MERQTLQSRKPLRKDGTLWAAIHRRSSATLRQQITPCPQAFVARNNKTLTPKEATLTESVVRRWARTGCKTLSKISSASVSRYFPSDAGALVPPSSFALAKVAGTPGTTPEAALAGKKFKNPTQQSMPPAKRRMCPCILECFARRRPYSSPEAWWPEGSEPRSQRRAGSRPAPSRGDLSARDECSILP